MTVDLAFDLGLRSTGVAWHDGSDTLVCPDHITGGERLDWWARTFDVYLVGYGAPRVAVEAPFIHGTNIIGAIPLIELHGVFRLAVYRAAGRLELMPPATLKKKATGRGNADKREMYSTAKRLRPDERIESFDEADAVCLFEVLRDREVAA